MMWSFNKVKYMVRNTFSCRSKKSLSSKMCDFYYLLLAAIITVDFTAYAINVIPCYNAIEKAILYLGQVGNHWCLQARQTCIYPSGIHCVCYLSIPDVLLQSIH